MKQSDKHPAPLPSPWHVFLKVLAIIFLAEVAGILLLEMVPLDRNSLAGDVADAAMLIVLSAPFLWWFVIRPLRTTALAEHVRASIVVEKAIDGIITIGEKGLVESFNPGAERIFGVTKEEMLGKPLTLLLPARFRDRHQQGLERLRSGGEPHILGKTVELHGLRDDGSEFPMELSLARWETGEGTFYTGIVRDITERKRAEEELRASEERYRLLFENNPQPMWVYDVETLAFLAVNDAAVRHYGYSRDEFLALTIRDIRPPEDVPKLLETVSKLSPGIAKSGEWRHRKKDGTILDVEIASHDFLFDRKPARLVLANDISERKRMEETRQALYRASLQIQEQMGLQDRLNRLLGSAREVLHLDRFIVLLADRKERWLEAVAGTGIDESLEALRVPIGPEGGGLAQAYLTKEMIRWDGLTPVPEALRLQPPYDQIKAFRSRAFANVPLVVQGRAIGVLGVDRKHSRRPLEPPTLELLQLFAAQAAVAIENARLYEERRLAAIQLEATVKDRTRELQEAKRQAEEASGHKSEFLASMSHELRTPLNAVISFSDLLREERVGPLTEMQTRYVGHIQRAGKHLLALIGDILDLSKVEAGKIVLQLESLAVASLLEDILVIARGLANKKAQEIRTEIASDLPPFIADPVRFKQICFNLLSNAVKFTPERGTITLTVRKASGVSREAESEPRLTPHPSRNFWKSVLPTPASGSRPRTFRVSSGSSSSSRRPGPRSRRGPASASP